ncbi:hypothetical protein [Miniphocaeibacter massiliensis]|uniref:hypothetical protein n=1 Tax=Miniphocaeibacter massiliensis TaxID=2041841 RepID=UPI000C1BFAA5|nr:hypothetical protein [Miniphocaeibacter massiliensis]
MFLVLFIFPVYKIVTNSEYNNIVGIVLGILAIIGIFVFILSKNVDLMGTKVNLAGSGMYLFLFSSIGFTVGNYLIKPLLNTGSKINSTTETKLSTEDKTDNNTTENTINSNNTENEENISVSNDKEDNE